jgi:pimeloyl-ACP methyl ester carboxylesterase
MKVLFCILVLLVASSSPAPAQSSPITVRQQLVLDSLPMTYSEAGGGKETILLIHGLGGNRRHWQANLAALGQDFRTIALDLPGYGASQLAEVPSGNLLHFFSTALAAFMDSLSIGQAHICGHSMGGQLAMLFSLRHPERVAKLILAAPAGFETFTQQEAAGLKQYAEASYPQIQPEAQIRTAYAMNFSQVPEAAEELIQERLALNSSSYFPTYVNVLIGAVSGILDAPVADRLSEIGHETLIIFGEEDKFIPNRHLHPELSTEAVARKGQQEITGSRLELIPDAGHLLMLEKPATFNELIKDFLKSTNPN